MGPVLVIAATWDHVEAADRVAEKTGSALAVMPASTYATEEASGYLDLFEVICGKLEAAAQTGAEGGS